MSDEDERKYISEEKREQLQERLEEIKEELEESLEEIKEEFEDASQELLDERKEIMEDLNDALNDLEDEKDELLEEGVDLSEVGEFVNKMRTEILIGLKARVKKYRDKVLKTMDKASKKAQRKMDKAERKAARRINISVEPELSEDWKDWAEGLGTSVSELVRKSMEFVKDNIGDLKKLERMGDYFEQMGGDLEKTIKESGIEDIGKDLRTKITIDTNSKPKIDKEAIKKRIQGIIKLHKSIPIDKLALAMNKKVEDAEKLIYELAGEGLDGTLEEGVFKYTGDIDDVILRFDKKIEEM
jgi:hypothetical protein